VVSPDGTESLATFDGLSATSTLKGFENGAAKDHAKTGVHDEHGRLVQGKPVSPALNKARMPQTKLPIARPEVPVGAWAMAGAEPANKGGGVAAGAGGGMSFESGSHSVLPSCQSRSLPFSSPATRRRWTSSRSKGPVRSPFSILADVVLHEVDGLNSREITRKSFGQASGAFGAPGKKRAAGDAPAA
jgi:hypothetical protein